jgi:hypothetical protein
MSSGRFHGVQSPGSKSKKSVSQTQNAANPELKPLSLVFVRIQNTKSAVTQQSKSHL